MISKELKRLLFLALCSFMTLLVSCGGDTATEPEEVSIDQLKAQITSVADISNRGNASDIQVEFTGSTVSGAVSEYRLIVAKSDEVANIDLATASALTSERYLSKVGGLVSYNETLRANHQDVNGDALTLETSYRVLVLSVGTLNDEPAFILSAPSAEVSIVNFPETSTLVNNLQANDGVSVDADGNVYVSNYGAFDFSANQGDGATIVKVSPSGAVSTFATGLANPVGNAVDAEGNLYVNDDNHNDFVSGNVVKISPDGTKTPIATIQGYPAGMLYGTDGNLYVTNYSRGVVSRVAMDGTVTELATDDRLAGSVGMAYDAAGNILVGNQVTGDILSVSPAGGVSLIGTVPTVVNNAVIGYITFFEGHVYATGIRAEIIYKVSLSGEVTVFAGTGSAISADGELLKASFSGPNGIGVDKERRLLYISEANTGNPKLRVIPLD